MALPTGIDLEQYKTQAKELLRAARTGDPGAVSRLRAHLPALESPGNRLAAQLADAQLVIARENGLPSWARFREYLLFRNAVAALDAGDVRRLESLLDAHPSILRYECRIGEWYEQGYFAGATLLRHLAGNPLRAPLPENIVEIARLLVERPFPPAEADATIALLLTSRQASERGVALPLIDVLTSAGARFDISSGDVLGASLLNHAPETARALAARGARVELHHAAALGDIASLSRMLSAPAAQSALDDALLFACIRGQLEAAELLVRRGAKGDALLSPGGQTPRTALHEAANRGHGVIVVLLLASGASSEVVDARWGGTAAGWAEAGGHPEIAALLSRRAP
jgi:peptide-methionine (S)-S-oxide reductase